MAKKSTWANRNDLDKKTIEVILKETDIERLGESVEIKESVPYPFDEMDLIFSLHYILEQDLVGEFDKIHSIIPRRDTFSRVTMEYGIPIPDRTELGRSTPRVIFEIFANTTSETIEYAVGRLYHTYQMGESIIVRFYQIPLKT